eukprot:5957268-Amphidinium_carterae.1
MGFGVEGGLPTLIACCLFLVPYVSLPKIKVVRVGSAIRKSPWCLWRRLGGTAIANYDSVLDGQWLQITT